MKILRVRLGWFWCEVLDEDKENNRVLVRDPVHYYMPRDTRPRRAPKLWVYLTPNREVTHGVRLK